MRERGFTLIEVMVSVAILALATVVLLAASARSLERLSEASILDTAALAGQRKLLELAAGGPPTLEELTPWAPLEATTDLGVQAQWMKQVSVVPVVPGQIGAQDPDTLRQLDVSIRLDQDPDAPVFRFSTLFPPPPPP